MRFLSVVACMWATLAGGAAAFGGNTAGASTNPAQKIYTTKCAKCHRFYDPARYSDAQWETWMIRMGAKAKLSPEQQEQLARWIEDTLRQRPAHK